MKKIAFIPILLVSIITYSQTDKVGAGRAILFDGIDDYIDLGNIYDDIALPITISAWVYVEPNSNVIQYPIFDSQDNSSVYNGFTFVCSTLPHIGFTIGDGKGGNNPAFRRSRAGYFQTLGKWVYMTAVARSGYDIHTYLNGHDVSGDYQGSSNSPMNSYSPGEVAKIGYLWSNGILFRFKGIMDELRIWNRALTENEIRESMCRRLQGNEPGLIGYWNFDETTGDVVYDQSPNQFHGNVIGNAQRVYSGAPVGDESAFLYTPSWTGKELSKDEIRVSNIKGTPFGIHIYSVNSLPSQMGGLPAGKAQIPYYGVFLADDGGSNTFDFSFTSIDAACNFYQRNNNSEPIWNVSETFLNIFRRIEIIPGYNDGSFNVDLGPDVRICDQPGYVLNSNSEASGRTYLWSTGETTPDISVDSSGKYSLQVREGCKMDNDTIQITFLQRPPDFSLGRDEDLCAFKPKILAVEPEDDAFDITWQDGSSEKYFLAETFGTYWVKVGNTCGAAYDSITFTQIEIEVTPQYNFISPDNVDDFNQTFMLDEHLAGPSLTVFNRWGKPVYHSPRYDNGWSGDDLPAGVYFYIITGGCIEPYKGSLTIMR